MQISRRCKLVERAES